MTQGVPPKKQAAYSGQRPYYYTGCGQKGERTFSDVGKQLCAPKAVASFRT